jgi:integrase/recombinase XerC
MQLVLQGLGKVIERSDQPGWAVVFPDLEHEVATLFLRDMAACDCARLTIRSYAYDLLRWFRFLEARGLSWERAERAEVRDLVELLREAPNPQRLRRSPTAPPLGSVNAITGKPNPRPGYASRTINHQLSVLASFYRFTSDIGLGPIVNPVPPQRVRGGGRPHAHRSPMEDFQLVRRATFRQRVPRAVPRDIPDATIETLFSVLRSNRDRALVAFWLSSGVRASELLGLQQNWLDPGRRTIKVITKGSRVLEEVPASIDAFVWLALYQAEWPPGAGDHPVWWTLRRPRRPLTYHAARAVFVRANSALGTNYTLHDLRHTAAARMAGDPNFTLVDVQTILRHAQVTTTQLYIRPRLEELIEKVAEHHSRPPIEPIIGPDYDRDEVAELLGMDR